MKILLISDHEERFLWEDWTDATAKMLSDVDFVLSAGDLQPEYLEFLVTMLNVPLVYVRGNHDGRYSVEPPEGCEDADGKIIEVECGSGDSKQKVSILGLGGSMRYQQGSSDMYTENEMQARIRKMKRVIKKYRLKKTITGHPEEKDIDIFLTHAPCHGYGDMEDLPHRGFECFNDFLNKYSPQLHCYGHVHLEYGRFDRCMEHPSGTKLINCSGHRIIDFGKP